MRRWILLVTNLFAVVLTLELLGSARADDWPQWLGPQRDGVWRETGLLEKFPEGGPKVLWRTPIHGGYASPSVAAGRVYVADRVLNPGEKDPDNPFAATNAQGRERICCLDAKTGKLLWEHAYECRYRMSYPAGPRASPVVADGKVYALGAMGNLVCLDASTGKQIWAKDFMKDYKAPLPMWGFAAHPLLDGDKLICLVGGKGSVVVAFDKNTGAEKWRALSVEHSDVGYAPPMIYRAGGVRQLIIWHPEAVCSLNPETGASYWSEPFTSRANLSIPTPRLEGNHLFITAFYNGSMMLELAPDKPAATVLWTRKGRAETPKETDGLHSIMPTPVLKDGHIYGVCSYGELRCLKMADGSRVWMTRKPTCPTDEPVRWANAFIVPQGDRYFLANELGDLIIAKLSPLGYEEIDRAHILEATYNLTAFRDSRARRVVWSHPAFADRCMFARNDKEIVCVSLAAEGK
jgi:outer membrane protein assembly factor BamB